MGAEYQGISNLFTSLLSVLNLAELGISSAIVYSMYKMIAEENEYGICALLSFYRRVYRIIGAFVLISGVMLIPFLNRLISGNYPLDINIYVIYMIYLSETVISYLTFGYKNSLLIAHQRVGVVNKIMSITVLSRCMAQCCLLIITRNFYLFTLMLPLFTLLNNVCVAVITNKEYPHYKCKGELDKKIKTKLFKQIGGLFLGKLTSTVVSSGTNIIISLFYGLSILALYNNYYYLMTSLYSMVLILSNSIEAGIGDSIQRDNIKKNYHDFLTISFIFSWITSWLMICQFCMTQDFIKIWIGESFLLSQSCLILFCFFYNVMSIVIPINLYFNANGLWWKARNYYFALVIVDIMSCFWAGKYLGLEGVLLFTIMALFLFSALPKLHILYKCYFSDMSLKSYILNHVYYLVCTIIVSLICRYIIQLMNFNGISKLVSAFIISTLMGNFILYIFYCKTKIYKETVCFIKSHIKTSIIH